MDEDVAMEQQNPKLVVGGKIIEDKHYRAFMLAAKDYTAGQIARQLRNEGYKQCEASTILGWKNKDWWLGLSEQHLRVGQRAFAVGMVEMGPEILKAYKEIVTGKDAKGNSNKEDRTANARMQGVSKFMEAGTDPLLSKKPGVVINNDNRTQTMNLNWEKIKELPQGKIQDMMENGIPQEFIIMRDSEPE